MQIVSIAYNLHKMSKLCFLWKNKKNINLLSAELALRVAKVKPLQKTINICDKKLQPTEVIFNC